MSFVLNQHQSGTLPSNTLPNMKNDSHYFAITTQSSKATIDPPIPVVDEFRNDVANINETSEMELEKLMTNE